MLPSSVQALRTVAFVHFGYCVVVLALVLLVTLPYASTGADGFGDAAYFVRISVWATAAVGSLAVLSLGTGLSLPRSPARGRGFAWALVVLSVMVDLFAGYSTVSSFPILGVLPGGCCLLAVIELGLLTSAEVRTWSVDLFEVGTEGSNGEHPAAPSEGAPFHSAPRDPELPKRTTILTERRSLATVSGRQSDSPARVSDSAGDDACTVLFG